MPPVLGLNLQPHDDLRAAHGPLLADGAVDAVEWTWEGAPPPWLVEVARFFASQRALVAHLVEFPVFGDPRSLPAQLDAARAWATRCPPRHVTAHVGIVAVPGYRGIAPTPVLPSRALVDEARARLGQLRAAVGVPVGLENLALALSLDDVRWQGELLDEVLTGDDVLLLDLHNLYCQVVNFGCDPIALLEAYPLARVRELHVAGGRDWDVPGGGARVRRDTHDGAVPAPVFELVDAALARCPNLEVVILERLGGTLATAGAADQLARDYAELARRVAGEVSPHAVARRGAPPPAWPQMSPETAEALAAVVVDAALAGADVPGLRARLAATLSPALLAGFDDRALAVMLDAERTWARRAPA